MGIEEKSILNYMEVLNKIGNQENHLLIGNGFNIGLGINTRYKEIFYRMIENNQGIYKDARKMVEECGNDLEKFIGRLEADIDSQNLFLKKYVRNKVKFDFMQSTHEIVKSEIKNIYAEKNEGIFLLLKNFTNYFSLNYDSFLYLFLLKYKTLNSDKKNAIALPLSLKFKEGDLNERQNNIYRDIKEAREKGELEIKFSDEDSRVKKSFSVLTKSHFSKEVKEYLKTNRKNWKAKDIDRVINLVFEEEKRISMLNKIDDGSRQQNLFENMPEFVFELNSETQNLFFLHGAFHIFKDGHSFKKVTQQSDKALYERLEEILNDGNKEIVCVFQHEEKTNVINDNKYLMNCLKKLGEIKGNIVIIGCSLADNDNHIYEQINSSGVATIYISTLLNEREKNLKLAKEKFPSKDIYLFNAETISYELPEDNEE